MPVLLASRACLSGRVRGCRRGRGRVTRRRCEASATARRVDRELGHGLRGRSLHARAATRAHAAIDGEIGVGLGAGGHQGCGSDEKGCDTRRWNDRIALGGYVGGGAAYHFHFFAIYARARAQPTIAEGTPGTLWGQAHGGVQFCIARTLDIFSSAGVAGLVNRRDRGVFFAWDLGVAIHFDVTGKRRGSTARRGLRLRM